MPELEVGGCHLGEGNGVVEGCDGDIAAVEDCGPGEVGVSVERSQELFCGEMMGGLVGRRAEREVHGCARVEASEGCLP